MRSLGPTNKLNRYKGGLVGDSPELMPLDNNLFADFSKSLLDNVCATRHLPKGHPDKFSIATPNPAYAAMQRTWEYHPTPERIAEDINRWQRSLQEVIACTHSCATITHPTHRFLTLMALPSTGKKIGMEDVQRDINIKQR